MVVLGGLLTLGGQWVQGRIHDAKRRKVILLALEEELQAVEFGVNMPGAGFGGFSSQTFDELFSDIPALLPAAVAQDVLRYHFRMKHLALSAVKASLPPSHVTEMAERRDGLLDRVRFERRS